MNHIPVSGIMKLPESKRLTPLKCQEGPSLVLKCSAPNPAGGVYSTPPDPLTGGEGIYQEPYPCLNPSGLKISSLPKSAYATQLTLEPTNIN